MGIFPGHGLDIALAGAPAQAISDPSPPVRQAALLGSDLGPMRTDLVVAEGDRVAAGAPLFRSRRDPALRFSAPVAGRVAEIVIGARRRLGAVVVAVEEGDRAEFPVPPAITRQSLHALLLDSGLWPALRARPFDRVADPRTVPDAILVMRADTRPHAPDPRVALAGREEDLARGVAALLHLTDGLVHLCDAPGLAPVPKHERVRTVAVTGPHPAGLVGAQLSRLHPVGAGRTVWHLDGQDAAAIGRLLATGSVDAERIVALGGPGLRSPRLVRVPIGCDLRDLVHGEITAGQKLLLSGSAIDGRESRHLGRYHRQATVLRRAGSPSRNWLMQALHRSSRPAAFIPTRALDHAMARPFAVVPLLRAISVGDAETAEKLGCLMLAEDDMALPTYVTGGGVDFGERLRAVLDILEEGA